MISAYLADGGDVVLPQMLVRTTELEKFEAAALSVGADFVELMLMTEPAESVARFHRRGGDDPDQWHDQVREIVAADGGDAALLRCHDGLIALQALRPATIVLASRDNAVDQTYAAVVEAIGSAVGPVAD